MERPPLPGQNFELEDEHYSVPPALPRPNNTIADTTSSGQKGESVERIQNVLGRRLLPKWSWFIPKFIRKAIATRYSMLPPDAKQKLNFILGISQWVFLIVFGLLFLAILLTIVTSATIIEPKTAKAVLDRVPDEKAVFYTTEIVRTKTIDGAETRQDQVIKVGSNWNSKKYQVEAQGVTQQDFRIIGDGKQALYQEGLNVPGNLRSYPDKDSLRPLLAQDINATETDLVSNQMTLQGKQGWLLTWKPDKATILRMMNSNMISAGGDDIAAIKAGKFKAVTGTVTVFRDTKRIYQVLAVVKVNGAEINVLNTYRGYDDEALNKISFKADEE